MIEALKFIALAISILLFIVLITNLSYVVGGVVKDFHDVFKSKYPLIGLFILFLIVTIALFKLSSSNNIEEKLQIINETESEYPPDSNDGWYDDPKHWE